ncbi:MAG: restriction endonuclease subunit S [Hydrogenophilales bacterium CG_4_9_14_3_um_filter_59_35]|nr:MAG: restriction endonuclease [Hydrogenophilales bacterium CG18_big_fil_WC_8_21_14_2_50_58_12]PIY00019.1 MAG: restriction endonuclease subunit S [Hydrogenophilales bacterium CG_4_10_14_3_um_filter_58_23]PJB05209.1 MAG: restriction endonuclease subunit S [Hydrogenophilales bacterium CG_4_9_14_3_um_filter_59_35]
MWTDSGALVLRSQNIRNGRLDLSVKSYTDEAHFGQRSRRAKLRAGDLVITREAPMGEVCIIPEGLRCCLGQRMVMLRPDAKKCDSRFLLYSIQSRAVQDEIKVNEGTGSTVSNLRIPLLEALPISHPPLPEQKAIAHILGTLDDKIELNRRMNATLEAMARALFQSWFVDFDPVRAKLDAPSPSTPLPLAGEGGRRPGEGVFGLDAATAALFPAHFQDSLLGHIPQGWTVEPVGEVVESVGGTTPSTAEPKFWEGGTHHWTTPKDFSSLQTPVLLDTNRKITDAGIAQISSGLLPAGTLLLSSRAPVGYLAIAAMPVAINQGFIAIKCNERASNFFMLNWCQTNMAEIESRATGTTFAEISKTNFRPIRVMLPPKELMAAFTEKVAPLYAQITANLHQSRTLATLRDALLPKLLSGELRVATLESQLGASL